ncbi:ABC transporter permease [Oceanobacillus damuensis]|uniref:ABC transporter permease n=1 Tax=Oceanobacillus damuensis TaxID=937928 RepID=UPI000834D6E2|nr:ABC transporter permease [Oceanobacillus damuensis]
MRVIALTKRILQQLIHDKRTLGLLIFAPILVLTMLHLVFNGDDYVPKVGMVEIPEAIVEQIDMTEAEVTTYNDESEAEKALVAGAVDGYIVLNGGSPAVFLEGSDPTVNSATISWIHSTFGEMQQGGNADYLEVDYLHGSSDMGSFDYFGPVLLGFFVFFFVFIIAGVSFIRERTTGTLERLLSTPIRKWEIVMGYVFGFGIFTIIQSTIIAWYAIYVLGMMMVGSFVHVLLITLLLALTALTLGILISSFANNELQMIQFIPIVVIPQIFFSGLFNLETISDWLSWVGPFTPLYYAADALRDVMVRGHGWHEIYINLIILLGFSLVFMLLNGLALRKYRKI